MTPSPFISQLLLTAERSALERFSGQPATLGPDGTIAQMAEEIRGTVVHQVWLGMWDEMLGPNPTTHYDSFDRLRVEIVLDLAKEPPLQVEYDFSKTALMLLQVKRGVA